MSPTSLTSGLGIFGATFVSEDLALVSALGLAQKGSLSLLLACLASGTGIYLGDLLLFYAGRSGSRILLKEKSPSILEKIGSSGWGGLSVFVARFLPGSRVITYVAAGASGMTIFRFAALTGVAVVLWVSLGAWLGQVLPVHFRSLALGAIFSVWGARMIYLRLGSPMKRAHTLSLLRIFFYRMLRFRFFEFWPMWIFYFPVTLYAIFQAIRYRSIRAPMDANPGIVNGGILGESKASILFHLSPCGDPALKYLVVDLGRGEFPDLVGEVTRWMDQAALPFPIVLKPDIGQRGKGVRLVRSAAEISEYFSGRSFRVIAQEYCSYPEEVGVNYRLMPGQPGGVITGITRKRFPTIVGDGKRTVAELILADPRARYVAGLYLKRHSKIRNQVLALDQVVKLVESGNHCQGAVFEDGKALITPELEFAIRQIAQRVPGLYLGRFDLRFKDEASLRAGHSFRVIELNGGAGEATHIYDSRFRLFDAYRVLFRQIDDLFLIGSINQKKGVRAPSALLASILSFSRISRQYPPTT